jgi:hypothetical protein
VILSDGDGRGKLVLWETRHRPKALLALPK